MSGSSWEGKAEVESFLMRNRNEINSVVDIGPGRGVYGLMCGYIGIPRVIAVEIFPQYAETYNYKYIYDEILFQDFTHGALPDADCAILGDVLEHVEKTRAVQAFQRIREQFKHIVLSIPIGHWPQGPDEGNKYEAHLSEWGFNEVENGICAGFAEKYYFANTKIGVFLR